MGIARIAPETQNFNSQFTGSTCTLRITASCNAYSAEGAQITQSVNNTFFREYTCAIASGLITIPEVELYTTNDASPPDLLTYTATFFDESGAKQNVKISDFSLDIDLLTANVDTVVESSMVVTAAGTAPSIGTYTYRGQSNLRGYWNLNGQPDSTSNYAIKYTGAQWQITSSVGAVYYYSTESVNTPADVVTWVASTGIAPLPVVTSAPVELATSWQAVFLTNNIPCIPCGTDRNWLLAWLITYINNISIPWASTVASGVGGKSYMSKIPDVSYQPIAVGSNEFMWRAVDDNRSLYEWDNNLEAAIADIGSDEVTLWITEPDQYTADGTYQTSGTLTEGETYEIVSYVGGVARLGAFNPIAILERGRGYGNPTVNAVQAIGGTGTGLLVDITFADANGVVFGAGVDTEGAGYSVGDIVELAGGSTTVKNAETAAVNGEYTQRGTSNSKPYYNLVGQANSTTNYAIVWTGTIWRINNSAGTLVYQSTNNVAYPWLVTTWTGATAVPTVTDNLCRIRINSVIGDDFSNVGATFFDTDSGLCPGNAVGTIFTATGTTPTLWTNGTALRRYITIPSNITLQRSGSGTLRATNGRGIFVQSMVDPGTVQFFTSDGISKIIVNSQGVEELNVAWWGLPNGTDDTHAFLQAQASAAKDKIGGIVFIPAGAWMVVPGRIVWTSQTTIKGVGGHIDGINVGTCIINADNDAEYAGIFEIQQQAINIAFENFSLVSSGVNFSSANSNTVNAFRYVAQGSTTLGLRFTNVNFFNNYGFDEVQRVEVASAGTFASVGEYTERGMNNNRFYYNLEGEPDSVTESAIIWDDDYKWKILSSAGATLYESDENVIYPWNVVTWDAVTGATPVPLVTNPVSVVPLTVFDGTSLWYEMINIVMDYCTWTCPKNSSCVFWQSSNSGGQFNNPLWRVGANSIAFVAPASGFLDIINRDCRGTAGYTISETPNRTITGAASITIGTNILTVPDNYLVAGAMFTNNDIGQYVHSGVALPDGAGDPSYPKYYITGLNSSVEATLGGGPNGDGTAEATMVNQDLNIEYLGDWTGGVAEAVFDLGLHVSFNVYGGADEGFQFFLKDGAVDFNEAVNIYGGLLQSRIDFDGGSSTITLYGVRQFSNGMSVSTGAPLARNVGGQIMRQLIRHDTERYPYPDTMKLIRGNAWHGVANREDFIFDSSDKDGNPYSEGEQYNFLVNRPARFIDPSAFGGPGLTVPVMSIMSANATTNTQVLMRVGQCYPNGTEGRYYYDFSRDGNTGHLRIDGNQAYPFNGVDFNAEVKVAAQLIATSPVWGMGYGSGAGGTVTQATSKATTVILNTTSGQITMNGAALASGATVMFQLTNSSARTYDTLSVMHASGGTAGAYRVECVSVSNLGGYNINVTNITGGSLSEAIVINFNILRGSPS